MIDPPVPALVSDTDRSAGTQPRILNPGVKLDYTNYSIMIHVLEIQGDQINKWTMVDPVRYLEWA